MTLSRKTLIDLLLTGKYYFPNTSAMYETKTKMRSTGASLRQNFLWVIMVSIVLIVVSIVIDACNSSSGNPGQMGPPQLPVISVSTAPATTYQEFPATLEGKVNVEIRPQVEGYIEKIYVDEGAFVAAGQLLFKIDPRVYSQQLNNAKSNLAAAQANMEREKVEVEKLTPLVENGVISEVQVKTAKANYESAKATVEQSRALVGNAQINMGYTVIRAPVSGYIGRLPFKIGSLVGKQGENEPLTMLSQVNEIYAYFSMSESDFIAFKNRYQGNTLEEKLKHAPSVELVLANDSVYTQKGKIELVEGQFDKTVGAINFRASFPNPSRILRTGNTGKIRLPQMFASVLIVPQEATFEIQDKIFVYAVADSNKIVTKPITVSGRSTNYYYVSDGVTAGEKVVLSSQSTLLMGGLRDGMPITPQMVSTDSLLKAKPL